MDGQHGLLQATQERSKRDYGTKEIFCLDKKR
jgi:hypothetical protein